MIERKRLDEHVRKFCELNRLTGEKEAEMAVDYICDQLKTYGVQYERFQFDSYLSDPISGKVTVLAPECFEITAKARSFCLPCPEGIRGELVYDFDSKDKFLSPAEQETWYRTFKDKIVVSWNYYEDYVAKLERAGVKGIIHIWPSDEDYIHEETVGTVWGTPTAENASSLPQIPVVGIKHHDGLRLIEQIASTTVTVNLQTELNVGIKQVSLPVAYIPGETEEYILLSGHYDSWHAGATDNAVGNALCLELAHYFAGFTGKLKRGVKIAWWPGHSNGRYAGSAWYCDHFWQDLNEKCVAHLNVDFPGTKGGVKVIPRSTRMEDAEWLSAIIAEYTGEQVETFGNIPRGADQSFWGVDIPIHLAIKYEPEDKSMIVCPGCAGAWWWHTEADLYDKVDLDLLVRDTSIHGAITLNLAQSETLPVNIKQFFSDSKHFMEEIDQKSDAAFDFSPIYQALDELAQQWDKIMDQQGLQPQQFNQLLKSFGGALNRLKYSSTASQYDFDNTFPAKPFPGLRCVENIYQENSSKESFLFAMTSFVRQRNRFIVELKKLTNTIKQKLCTYPSSGCI